MLLLICLKKRKGSAVNDMELKKKLVVRKIAGETVLIPVGDTTAEFNGLFSLSPTAATAFEAISHGEDEEGALQAILDEYEIDEETAKNDLNEFLETLREFGII